MDDPTNGFANITLANGGQIKLEIGTNFASEDTWNLKGFGDVSGDSGVDASQGQLARPVVRVDFGIFADTAAMWVNPSNLANLGPADVSITEPGANYSFNRIMIRSGNNSSNRLLVDSIFVADTTSGAPAADTPSNTSACCLSDGTCETGDANFCAAIGGESQGDYSTCAFAACEAFAACCLDSTTCEIENPSDCITLGGAYRGDGILRHHQLFAHRSVLHPRWQLLPRHGRQLRSRWRHLPRIRCELCRCDLLGGLGVLHRRDVRRSGSSGLLGQWW